MPFVCDLCGGAIADAQPRIVCGYEPYSDEELAVIFGRAQAHEMHFSDLRVSDEQTRP